VSKRSGSATWAARNNAATFAAALFRTGLKAHLLKPVEIALQRKRRLFPILLRGLSTVEDLRFSALLRQIERSRGNVNLHGIRTPLWG
jgi:hypothetical protein